MNVAIDVPIAIDVHTIPDITVATHDVLVDVETDSGVPTDAIHLETETVSTEQLWEGQPLLPLLAVMETGRVQRYLGRYDSTNVIYRFELEGGVQVAFKPDRAGQVHWWQHDVTAYALAQLLGLSDRVPPVVGRSIPLRWLQSRVEPDRLIHPRRHPRTYLGSATFWMPVLVLSELHTKHGHRRWAPWLRVNGPVAELPTASDISSLIVFDYLQANEDRWNAANVRLDAHGRILYRDNNNGWFDTPMANVQYGLFRVKTVERFSRSFVHALEHADPTALRGSLSRYNLGGHSVVSNAVVQWYEARRQMVLAHIHRLIARHGEGAVLAWP